jgi:predicted XRE-type DNA-binding protein
VTKPDANFFAELGFAPEEARLYRELSEGIAIDQGSSNPYADLGYPGADEMLAKARLAHEIGEIICSRHLTQQRAAELLGIPQSKLSEMLRGKFRRISQAEMIECLNRLGRDVDIMALTSETSSPFPRPPAEDPARTPADHRA